MNATVDPRAPTPMLAGAERDSVCDCGSPVHQVQVSREWFKAMDRDRAILYAQEACTIDPDRTIWTPQRCTSCERTALNTNPPPNGGTSGTGIKISDKDNNDRRYGTD